MYINKLIFLWIENNKYGFIDSSKKNIIPCKYNKVSKLINDHVWLFDDKWNYVNWKNELILEKFDNLIDYNGYYSLVKKKSIYYLIDHENENHLIKIKNDFIPVSINDCKIIIFKKNKLYGFMDINQNILSKPIYNNINNFHGKLTTASINNKWGIIDNNNKIIAQFNYDFLSNIPEGYIKAIKDNQTFFIDVQQNKYLINFNNKYIFDSYSDLMLGFKYKNKQGYMNQFFEIQIIKKFDEISKFDNGFAIVKYKNKYGVINQIGKYILKPIYDRIIEFDGYTFFVEKNKKLNHIFLNKTKLIAD